MFPWGTIPSLKLSKGIFNGNRTSWITFERSEIDKNVQRPTIPNRVHWSEWWRHCRSSTPPSGWNRHSATFRKRKTAYSVETVQDKRKMLLEHEKKTMVALSTGDVTSGLGCPLAAEIYITPKSTTKKTSKTLKRCMLDKSCVLNTNRKPCLSFRSVISFPV
jgi:hypothetical protein